MRTKVDQTSVVEPHIVNMSTTTTSPIASTMGPKASRFAAKTGFVIPKNKLSGSLVPIYRGGKKPGGNDTANEDNMNQVQRKTKWGPDLTQDAAVRSGRALAYQIRVDQITQLLKSGNLDVGVTEDSALAAENMVKRSSDTQLDNEKLELLEIERREAIGEILKLNPSYKAPTDYKPLFKEATVSIPVKEYPGCNFAGLIFGPESDTKKRLEKETGAKVQVYGIKANDGEKVEIFSPDDETQEAYEQLYVHLSADTFEKVDGAVALIELLVSSISGNLGTSSVPTISGNDVKVLSQTLVTAMSCVTDAALSPPVPQPMLASPQGQFQYHNSWFPSGPSPLNFSAPIFNSSLPAHNSLVQTSSFVSSSPQLPTQVSSQPYLPRMHPLGHSGPPRNFIVPNPNPPTRPSILSSLPYTENQPQGLGPIPGTRLSMPFFPETASNVSSRPLQEQLEVPAGSSKGWSGTYPSLGLSNVGQLAPSVGFSQVPHSVVPRPVVASSSTMPQNMSASYATGQSGPRLSSVPLNHPSMPYSPGPPLGSSPALPSVLHPTAVSVPTPVQSSSLIISMAPSPSPSINPAMASRPLLTPLPSSSLSPSMSGNMANFAPLNQPVGISPRLQHASSGDFTFRPHPAQVTASPMVPMPGNQAANPYALAPRSAAQLQASSFQFGVPNSAPRPAMQVFSRPQNGNQMGLRQAHIPSLHTANPIAMSASLRPPAFPSTGTVANTTPGSQMGLRNFAPPPRTHNMAGPFPSMPGHSLQRPQHYPALPTRPGNFTSPNPRFASNHFPQFGRPTSGHSTGKQVYDPFSPTSDPVVPQHQEGGHAKGKKQESDPEYEDFMASVGVK